MPVHFEHSYLPPVIAGAAVIVSGLVPGRRFVDRAWDFVTLLLVANRLTRSDVSRDVRDATFGIAAAVALLMVAEFVGRLVIARRHALPSLPGIAAVLGIVVIAYRDVAGVSAATWWGCRGHARVRSGCRDLENSVAVAAQLVA